VVQEVDSFVPLLARLVAWSETIKSSTQLVLFMTTLCRIDEMRVKREGIEERLTTHSNDPPGSM
jgi:hypothetical protein